ncbi:cyclic-di-AMP receptor [Candidatus Soleaferrea massiliensis]|uniref:cyclic-di-AMP receptor n=1 Tax=Candidatus Soleaferrea massiliensis TaxID=1470354 RepID=UPI000590B8F3|nr:cyclic-di-AMP receptor [Candidatus Soleaferrea massiliensis]
MKLIFAIVSKDDKSNVNHHLIEAGFSVTRLSSQGGFLQAGNTTLLIGTEDERVDDCIRIIEEYSKTRKEVVAGDMMYGGIGVWDTVPLEVTVGGATIFVVNVERFEKV